MNAVSHVMIVNDHGHVNGGQAKVAIESARELAKRGLKVTFFCACGPIDARLKDEGVSVVCLHQQDLLSDPNRVRAATRGLWNARAASTLKNTLDHCDPKSTIIHCHGFAKALSPSIGPVIANHAVPHAYTMHEYFLACPNGGFFNYRTNSICHRKAMSLGCITTNCDSRHSAHKAWRVARQLILSSLGGLPGNLANVIYISELQRQLMRQYLPAGVAEFFVANPVTTEKGDRVKVEENSCYTFVGRLAPEKGGVEFARAARRAGIRAVFVGDGPERGAITKANPDAEITGWLDAAGVEDRIAASRCLVFPSRWYECAPLVVFEALASGVPVLCGRWTAAAEAVVSVAGGTLVDNDSEDDWVAALLSMEEMAEPASRRCYNAYWRAPNTIDKHATDLQVIYNRIVAGVAGPGTAVPP
jgi:glycosyltransferase involved in cell wall biosynthesis